LYPRPYPTRSYARPLHDALPISTPSTSKKKTYHSTTWDISLPVSTPRRAGQVHDHEKKKIILIAVLATVLTACTPQPVEVGETIDRKSTRLNSSHVSISYAVFCL